MRKTLFTALILAAPRLALACPVCFGQNDSPMAQGVNMGILAMLVVIGGVLAGFATFMIHLVRRAQLVDRETAQAQTRNPQEGTASC